MNPEIRNSKLKRLDLYLRRLPSSLTICESLSRYDFVHFSLDPDWVEAIGSVEGAVNRELEVRLGTRANGPIEFVERGPQVEALVGVLDHYSAQFPDDILLAAWIDDSLAGAIHTYSKANTPLPDLNAIETNTREPCPPSTAEQSKKRPATAAASLSADAVEHPPAAKRPKTSGKKVQTKLTNVIKTDVMVNYDANDLVDIDDPESNNGRPRTALLHDLTISCKTISTNKTRYRCGMTGCLQSWSGKRQAGRIYKHILDECKYANNTIRKQVGDAFVGRTLHAQLEATEVDVSLEKMSKAEGKKARALKINQAVLNLICGTGIPPTIVDTDEWKNFISTIDNGVSTFSSTSFVDTYIPGEAARITEEKIQMLSKVKNLTISYDGGTTKAVESIYTIHVTTPRQRQAYLIEGNEASGVSHTGPQIANELFKVMDRIGRKNFSGISSDSTGNTRLAREIVAKSIPWIIILPDVCHLLNNTAKDISKIPFFIDTISHLRSIIKFFRKSSYAKRHLTVLRTSLDIKKGLVAVGNTRFLTFYHSGSSLRRCLPPIKELIESKVLKLTPQVGIYWMRKRDDISSFENGLRQLVLILEPLARACKCLESSKATAGDVYLFWLAVLATYEQLFVCNNDVDGLQLPEDVIDQIRRIVNARWKELTTGPGKSVYLSTFFLDYRYIKSPIFKRKNMNPISLQTIISTNSTRQAPPPAASDPASDPHDTHLRETMPAYSVAGKYLLTLLMEEIRSNTAPEVFNDYDSTESIIDAFRKQFASYTCQEPPFNCTSKVEPLAYWKSLIAIGEASVLAVLGVKLYSVVPNSMAEERTVSTFTKLNSADRAAQKADTIVNITKVKQHLRRKTTSTRSRPVVRFCDISKYVKDSDRQARPMKTSTDDSISHRSGNHASSSTKRSEPLPADSDHAEEVGETKGLEDGLWEDGDDDDADDEEEEEEEENPVLKSARETASSTAMDVEVDDGVDIGVAQLRDYLSDHPSMSPLVREGPKVIKKVASSSAPKVFEVRDMMF